ncbi:geraniol 8-hydroxylase-like [Phoenix dactylifera]|uniref:Geraniol 8-hydroxylase-like n=1 Tax=Phoenix dactylifera TaxID=42345 RepID=A0A8B8ZPN8_PHODC|nr:geraniol 8-hydroxylase-like [Phoenix dactylifera]
MEFFSLLLLWISVTLPLFFLLTVVAGHRSHSQGLLPPGPRPLPVVGSLLQLGNKPHQSLARLAKTYGPLMSLRLGQVTTIVVSSPEIAREVLQKKDAAFSSRSIPDAVRALGHADISIPWLPPAKQWRSLRRICNTELFNSQTLDAHQSLRRQKVQELLSYISDRSLKGLPVDIGRVAFTTSLNLLSRTIFSVDLIDLYSESSQEFKGVVLEIMKEAGGSNLSDFFPRLAPVDPQGRRRRLAALFKKMEDIFDEQIDRRLQSKEEHQASKDFLEVLLHRQVQQDSFKIDRQVMKALFVDLFAAGSDTSSSTVEWAMTELLRSPRCMAKARDEVARVIGREKEVEESDIGQLPYLQAVVKETFRLHPPVPFLLPRKSESTVELHGYTVPAGTRVLVNVWAFGRDGEVWPEPNEFKPERFLEREVDFRGRDMELIPFGAGRRICPGLPLAFRIVHSMLASLLQKFDWKLPDGMGPRDVDMTENFGITLAKAVPLRAIAVSIA